ncbi:unnamed protein product [Rhizophagus irregularis]|uniref:Uncharacterized protein n=1 Tax=Rhizophagus irregularis TaxID=588596 RepID=A0A915YS20_9GLOM|nr:unnamed protein product [Rhizophagus irregularis]
MKGKKPIFIDLVDEDDKENDDTIQQNKRNNDQSTQQNERNNDSNESALQMQIEELTRLLKSVTKGKQKPKYMQKYGIPELLKSMRSRLSLSPSPSFSSSSLLTSSSPFSKSAPSSNLSSFLHYEKINRDQSNALRVPYFILIRFNYPNCC